MATTSAPNVSDTLIHDSLLRAVDVVCQTMIKLPPKFVEKASTPSPMAPGMNVFGCVGFGGLCSGMIYVCLSSDFAKFAAGNVLTMTPFEIESEGDSVVNDVVGELTNMTAGRFKNALCDVGFPCKLSLPSIIRAQNLAVASLKSAKREVYVFDVSGHRLIIDMQVAFD